MTLEKEIAASAKDDQAAKELEAKIAALKKKYARPDATGKKVPLTHVHVLTVGDKTAYLRTPDRKVLSMARTLGEGDYIRIQELILDAVWLEGDEEIRNDDEYFLQAISVLDQLIEAKAVSLKKS